MIGDVIETAIWLSGKETPEDRKRFEADVCAAVASFEQDNNAICGPVMWTEKLPGEDRTPEVPDHIAGPDVKLLVGESVVVGTTDFLAKPSSYFADDLEPDDLARLRKITRKEYRRRYPHRAPLTDEQCRTLINDLGPEAALDALRSETFDVDKILH